MNKQSQPPESTKLAALTGDLRIAVNKLVRRMRKHSHPDDLTSAQKSVLFHLYHGGPATVSALARAESMKPQSMRIAVAGLEALGVVKGETDPSDGRKTLIHLTSTFRGTLQESRAAREDWLIRAIQAQLSAQEQAALAAALGPLQRLADF